MRRLEAGHELHLSADASAVLIRGSGARQQGLSLNRQYRICNLSSHPNILSQPYKAGRAKQSSALNRPNRSAVSHLERGRILRPKAA